MCRLFGSISSAAPDLEGHLVTSKCSLLAQSTANPQRLQRDGWGIAHYGKAGKPSIVLSTGAVFNEKKQFSGAVANASGRMVIAHIRAASNPLGLPSSQLLRPENQQPFTYKEWVFAHNGTLKLPDELMAHLGGYRRLVRGNNDSEVYFWLFIKTMEETGSVQDAFPRVQDAILKAWDEAPAARKKKAERPYVGLNCIFSDGERLYAICKYDGYRPKGTDSWLCPVKPRRPLFEMCYRVAGDGKGLVVASERTEPSGDWLPLKDGSMLEARLDRGLVQLDIESL